LLPWLTSGGNDGGGDPDRYEQQPEEDDRDREPALHVACSAVDRACQRNGEEDRDQEPL